MKFESKYKYFIRKNCVWKCRLRNGGHLSRGWGLIGVMKRVSDIILNNVTSQIKVQKYAFIWWKNHLLVHSYSYTVTCQNLPKGPSSILINNRCHKTVSYFIRYWQLCKYPKYLPTYTETFSIYHHKQWHISLNGNTLGIHISYNASTLYFH